MAAFEQLAHQNTQPDFDLVHPRSMLGSVGEHHLVGRIMQKRCATFHRVQNPALAFDSRRLRGDAFQLVYPADQRFGLMDIQVVQDDAPSGGLIITGNQPLEMRQRILFGACGSPGGNNDLSGDDIEIDEPGQGAMPNRLKLAPQHMAWLHGQIGMLALGGLHTSQLIYADAAFSALGPFDCARIQLTPLVDFLVALLIGNLGQPVTEAVRLEPPYFRSRAACLGEICLTMPRFITSSAISRPVHWLMGRPA